MVTSRQAGNSFKPNQSSNETKVRSLSIETLDRTVAKLMRPARVSKVSTGPVDDFPRRTDLPKR